MFCIWRSNDKNRTYYINKCEGVPDPTEEPLILEIDSKEEADRIASAMEIAFILGMRHQQNSIRKALGV